ncbi:hypothetical protein V5O48_014863, partial [Marasmius crinis-equi]
MDRTPSKNITSIRVARKGVHPYGLPTPPITPAVGRKTSRKVEVEQQREETGRDIDMDISTGENNGNGRDANDPDGGREESSGDSLREGKEDLALPLSMEDIQVERAQLMNELLVKSIPQ